MSVIELYKTLHGKPLPVEVENRLLKLGKALNVQENDALWVIILILDFYQQLYQSFPEQIKKESLEAVGAVRKANQETIHAAGQNIRKAEADARSHLAETMRESVQTLVGQAIDKTRSDTYDMALKIKARKWITMGLGVGVCGMLLAGGFGYWKGKEHGYAEVLPLKEEIGHLIKCDRPGWERENKNGIVVCYPLPAPDKSTYGWMIEGGR